MQSATFAVEQTYWDRGIQTIAGVDEVGRGAFAGPVVAAAVILPKTFPSDIGVNDSKLLTAQKREALAKYIRTCAISYATATIPVSVINHYGIARATQKAFQKAIWLLSASPEHILIDAFYIKTMSSSFQYPIIKGDQISISIAAASIIAKVERDRLMCRYGSIGERYSFSQNKGYGTKLHREKIRLHVLSKFHRTSFNLAKFL